jgi:hypothetical protein
MKLWISGIFFLGLTAFANAAETRPTETIFLSSCNRYPTFHVEDIRREKYGPELYDLIYYDLNYRKVEKLLLLIKNGYGTVIQEKEIERDTPQQIRFSISERIGNEQTVAKDVKAYLRANAINACP